MSATWMLSSLFGALLTLGLATYTTLGIVQESRCKISSSDASSHASSHCQPAQTETAQTETAQSTPQSIDPQLPTPQP